MSKIANQEYLKEQYRDSTNLGDRIQLHARFSTNGYGWHRWVFDQIHQPPAARVLELGCGPGRLWQENLDRLPADWAITLSDFSPGMLADARRNLGASVHPFAFEVVDAQSIPFDDAGFDAVVANHMLYHVPDRPRALAEIRRVLKPGGHFYATTIGETHLRELFDLALRFDPDLSLWGRATADSFLLENGAAQIEPYFANVTLRRYEDALVVAEADPLVAFIASGAAGSHFAGARRAAFLHFVEAELKANGSIFITKDSGIFEAW